MRTFCSTGFGPRAIALDAACTAASSSILGIVRVVLEAFGFVAVAIAVMWRVLSLLRNIHAHGNAEEKRESVEKHPEGDAREL
jgi:hypothetical protein